jgi:carboxylate-amine ligase
MLDLPVPLTLGIEEEYQIIDPRTRDLAPGVDYFLARAADVLPEQLKAEFMQCQVEVGSLVCQDIESLRVELQKMRRGVFQIAASQGLEIVAASTHPFASWTEQNINAAERYQAILADLGTVASQLLICGLHIHLGFGHSSIERNLMMEIMNQLRYFLPHLLAISCSSPFWQGRDTGLKSYRSVIFEMLPRTGMPEVFKSYGDYLEFVSLLGKVGAIGNGEADATKIWWDIRPHPKFGTLEVRIADICTNMEDAITVAAVLQALVAKLIVLRQQNLSWRILPTTPFGREQVAGDALWHVGWFNRFWPRTGGAIFSIGSRVG